MKRYVRLGYILIAIVVIYQLIHTVSLKNTTGIVVAHSTDASATLTVTKSNYLEGTIGIGNARIRLQPGSYTVTASTTNRTASREIDVKKGQVTTVNLQPSQSSGSSSYPSVATQATDNSLVRGLPFIGAGLAYRIDYKFTGSDKSHLVITITAPTTDGQQLALTWLEGLGYNPSNLDIQYYFGEPVNSY